MFTLKLNINGEEYVHEIYSDEYFICKYIFDNPNIFSGLSEKNKIIKSFYCLYSDEEMFIYNSDTREIINNNNAPILENDIKWIENESDDPREILLLAEKQINCEKCFRDYLGEDCVIGVGVERSFYLLHEHCDIRFSISDLRTITSGEYEGKYRLKKNRAELISRIRNVIESNYDIVRDYVDFETRNWKQK